MNAPITDTERFENYRELAARSPTPTPPCLGEREAVARTLRQQVRDCIGETIPLRRRWVTAIMDRVVGPLHDRALTAKAERDAAIARAEEQANRIAQMERWLGLTGDPALRPTIEASHELGAQFDERFRARVRENFGLTNPEPPHGD